MRILLATLSIEPDSRFENDVNSAYPLGLTYLQSVLEKNGNEVKLLFLNNFDYEYSDRIFFNSVELFKPQIVGFQIFSMNRTSTFRAIEKMIIYYPNINIIIGGIHTSVMYEQIINKYPNVIAILGEGEHTIIDLVETFKNNNNLEEIKGIAFFKENQIFQTKPRDLIDNLDSIPFPKHETFFDDQPNRTIGHIITSRGCPFDCSFCCLKIISKHNYRKRKIEEVVKEIKYLKLKYPRIKHIQFHDDTFLLDNSRVIGFCKMIIKEKLNLTFECSARVKPVSSEMFYWMKKANFKKIMFGLETGSEKLLKSIHKNINKHDVIKLFTILKPFNFVVTTFLMCGFPGESDDTITETIKLVQETQRISYNWIAGVGKLWVYPGTEVYTLMKNSGYINDDFWLSDKQVPYYTVEHSLEDLIKFENRIMDSVSIGRILTIRGFRNHFLVMPLIVIKYIFHNKDIIMFILNTSNLYKNLRRFYKKIKRSI